MTPPFEVQISETRGGSITWGRLNPQIWSIWDPKCLNRSDPKCLCQKNSAASRPIFALPQVFVPKFSAASRPIFALPQVFASKFSGRFAADFCPTPSVCTKKFWPLRGRFLCCPKCFSKIFRPRSGPIFFLFSGSNISF